MEIVEGSLPRGSLTAVAVFTYPSFALETMGKRMAEVYYYEQSDQGVRRVWWVDRRIMSHTDAMQMAKECARARKLNRIYERYV